MAGQNPRSTYDLFRTMQPSAHDALIALGKTVDEQGIEKELTELVKLRVSQINGCAFCLQLHLNVARKLGISSTKLDLVSVWRETDLFSEREAAALAWAEKLTQLAGNSFCNEDWENLLHQFAQDEAELLTVTIATINAWNRIGIGLAFPPPIPAATTLSRSESA